MSDVIAQIKTNLDMAGLPQVVQDAVGTIVLTLMGQAALADQLEEAWYCRSCLSGKDGRDCDTECDCPCHGTEPPTPEHQELARKLVSEWSGKPWGLWASGMELYDPKLEDLQNRIASLLARKTDA